MSEKSNSASLATITPSAPGEAPVWHSCLVADRTRISVITYKSSSVKKRSCTPSTPKKRKRARTHIFPTHAPLQMVAAMCESGSKKPFNFGKRDGKRTRMISKPLRRRVSSSSSKRSPRGSSELVAVVWPFSTEEEANRFSADWANCSRSLPSRAISGAAIASKKGLNSTLNWHAVFEIDEHDVCISEQRDATTGALKTLQFHTRTAK